MRMRKFIDLTFPLYSIYYKQLYINSFHHSCYIHKGSCNIKIKAVTIEKMSVTLIKYRFIFEKLPLLV